MVYGELEAMRGIMEYYGIERLKDILDCKRVEKDLKVRYNGKMKSGQKAEKSCQIGIISCPKSLKRQWPPKLSYTSGSLTSISSFSQYTRPTV